MRSPLALALAAAATAALALPAVASASYSTAVLSSKPLAYYPFTDPTPTADASGNGATLAAAGSPAFDQTAPFLDAGTAVKLGSADSLSATVTAAAAPQTIEFWVDPSARAAQTFVAYGGGGGFSVGIAPNGVAGKPWAKRKLLITVGGAAISTRVALSTGTWTMIDAVLDGAAGKVHVYLNGGATVKDFALPGLPTDSGSQPVKIGPSANKATTTIDEVALYPQALSAADVAAHFGASPLPDAVTAPALSPLAGVKVGDTLHFAQGTYASGTPVTVADTWERCNDAVTDPTLACVDFDPATASSAYTLQTLDEGYTIQVKETATNASGSIVTITDATDPVLAADGAPGTDPGTNPPPPGDNGNPPVDTGTQSGTGGGSGAAATTTPSGSGVSGRQTSCVAGFASVKARVASVGARKLRLSFASKTRTLKLSAPRRSVRSVVYRLDGKRLRSSKKAPYKAVIALRGLRTGRHTLKATVTVRGGKARTLTLRLTLKGC
jgi:concanavalin A-like lectin/glucanase superfamily protein